MESLTITEKHVEHVRDRVAAYNGLAERYRDDSDFRSRVDGGDVTDALSEIGLELPPGVEARIVTNTADTVHVVLPPDPNVELADESLTMVAGGKTAGTVSQGCGGPATYGGVSEPGFWDWYYSRPGLAGT